MTLTRGQLLTIGPFALVALCYAVAAPSSARSARDSESPTDMRRLLGEPNDGFESHLRSKPDSPSISFGYEMASGDEASAEATSSNSVLDPRANRLVDECRQTEKTLRGRLDSDWRVIVRPPFVLAGDCSGERLAETYRHTVIPTARALNTQYFDQTPRWPVTIVLCSSDSAYRDCQKRLGERDRSEYAGYYSRIEHRIVINVATGDGTLAHELTHALAHADFPDLPEWIDEGLASLHEECEFSSDGLRLVGLENWRRAALTGDSSDQFDRSIRQLAGSPFAKSNRAAADYAYARYFCLFLQEHHLLEPFYRKCRSRVARPGATMSTATDRDHASLANRIALASLRELLAARSDSEIDAQFETWLNQREAGSKPKP